MKQLILSVVALLFYQSVYAQTISASEFAVKIAHPWKDCEIELDEIDQIETDTSCEGRIMFTKYGTCVAELIENGKVTDKIHGAWKWDPAKSNLILTQTKRKDFTETAVFHLMYIKEREILFQAEGEGGSRRILLVRED